ncbi:MAG: site-specific DNA-methyltransferase, partial [Chitinophagaceae bacterium]|nr:site-specific DNA-methyltransferase [Chitinophagaceae bacterium]
MKLFKILEEQLKKEPNFVTDEGELKKWVVLNKAQNFGEEVIALLLENAELKETFFVNVKGTMVFKQYLFVYFLEQKNYLNDSYTQYKNKVGLTIDRKYLKQRNEVALVWPFKDCILEGGQSREEDKREEIFFNQILAQDEITQLLEPKVLTNAKRFDKDGEKPLFPSNGGVSEGRGGFNRNENGTITDNLIIKGNNLLALHTLKKEFAGKIKLIYIDQPYNTGNDGFKYNDRFNHSTWLTFMKNRLEVARQFLRDDGVIFVQCDDNEQAYLKVLMDEVFEKKNFIENFMWLHGKGKKDKNTRTLQEYVLCYAKNEKILEKWNIIKKAHYTFSNPDNDPRGSWFSGSISFSEERSNIHHENYFSIESPSGIEWKRQWQCSKEEMMDYLKNSKIYFGNTPKYDNVPRLKIFSNDEDEIIPPNIFDNHGTTRSAKKELKELGFHENLFDTPKTEKLIASIIEISTKEGDIVLDFFGGSGTTGAVAHKMNRQYILIEQMNYIQDLLESRLIKVISGEQGGISKTVNWQGGGSFVYMELKKYNETFIEQIQIAKDSEALLQIWEQMKAKSFLNY